MMTRTITTLAAFSLSLLACDARTLIGMVPDSGTPPVDAAVSTGDAGHTCTPVVFPNDVPYTLPAGVAGSWTGYFQGSSPLFSDVLRFSLQQRADGTGEIHVTMGTAAPPPPATDPTDYYPPGTPPLSARGEVVEGFSYLAHEVTWQATRLKFVLPGTAPWESWCALQTSYYVASVDRYQCVPGSGGSATAAGNDAGYVCVTSDGTKQTQVPCAQFDMCNDFTCTCDACGCAASPVATASFDVTFDGNLVTGVGLGRNVRLTRD